MKVSSLKNKIIWGETKQAKIKKKIHTSVGRNRIQVERKTRRNIKESELERIIIYSAMYTVKNKALKKFILNNHDVSYLHNRFCIN